MTPPEPNEETAPDEATSPQQHEGSSEATAVTDLPVAAETNLPVAAETDLVAPEQPASEAAGARPSLAEADPLLSLLRGGTLPPAPVVSGERHAKTEKAELEKTKPENAKPDKAKLENAKSEKAKPKTAKSAREKSESAKSETPPPGDLTQTGRHRMEAVGAAILVLACVAGALFLSRGSLFRSPLLGHDDRLMVATIENRTGDERLDGAVAQALEFELQESPDLAFRGSDAYRSAARQLVGSADRPPTPELARQAAEAAGAKAYLYGTLRASGAAYVLSVDILDAVDNRKLVELQETAASREQIPRTIESIAATLRSKLVSDTGSHPGKGSDPPLRSDVPLNREATSNLDALHDYSLGEAAALDGRTDDALAAFQSAVADDPRFIQAQMQLSWLYRRQHAETASAAAARLAEQAAGTASERTSLLARYAYGVNATGNLVQADAAIRRFAALYPHDPQGALGLARLLLMQARPAEALDAAQRGLADDPYDAELYQQAELALIGLGRSGDALALQQKAQRLGVEPAQQAAAK